MDGNDPCAVLGVPVHASPAEIKRAYRARVQATHPDHGGARGDLEQVVGAYRALRRRRPNPFAAVLTPTPAPAVVRYDSPQPAQRRPRPRPQSFDDLLRQAMGRPAPAAVTAA